MKGQTIHMRILITGGAGFIGSALANRLHSAGHYVRVLDNLSSGDPARLGAGVNIFRSDVNDIPRLWSVLQRTEVVYHLAARVSVPASILYPREYNDVNVGGTVSLLEACRDVEVKRVILASSATVYGNHTSQPVSEVYPTRPAVPYAVSKLAAEHYLFNIARLSGFESVALRIFNAYGPGQMLPASHPPVIPQFVQQTMGRGSLVVFGDGSQTRDFVYIDDIVDALIAALDASDIDQQIINVGSGEETSINRLIELIGKTLSIKPNVLYNQESSSGIARQVADLATARKLLGYNPQISLEDGLKKLVNQDPVYQRAEQNSALVGSIPETLPK